MLLALIAVCFCTSVIVYGAVPEPNPYILSFPTEDNVLNVKVNTTNPEMNYILLIGDWGAHDSDTTDLKVQTAVAAKMKTFYNNYKSKGMNLLFVGTVGDNFYFDGQNCSYWTKRWTDMYGEMATDYPWLAVMGNHDWGNDDPHAICAWGAADIKYTDPNTKIPYAGNQLNQDKKGCNPSNYYLPDYGYYYTINELNFEWIGLEETVTICPSDMGGQNYKDCNGSSQIGCKYLGEMRDASEKMLKQRANVSTADNFLISQHYPQNRAKMLNIFNAVRGNRSQTERIWSIYGHNHVQECNGNDKNGDCNQILTGGGSGCCGNQNTLRGFYVIGFDKDSHMTQPYKINDPAISCQFPCGTSFTQEEIIKSNFYYCCYTSHGINCDLYDLSKC